MTLTLKIANCFSFFFFLHNTLAYFCSITIPSLVTKCFVAQKISPGQLRSGELRTQKLKSHLVRTHSLNVLPLKLGVGQYIAIHATLTARDFFLAYFYPSSPFTCIFPNLSQFFLCWLWLTHGSCVDPQNKIGHTAGCRFTC